MNERGEVLVVGRGRNRVEVAVIGWRGELLVAYGGRKHVWEGWLSARTRHFWPFSVWEKRLVRLAPRPAGWRLLGGRLRAREEGEVRLSRRDLRRLEEFLFADRSGSGSGSRSAA